MSKCFQECWSTIRVFNFNEVAKAGSNRQVTFEEGFEGGGGLSL